jgi:predicted esterase
VRTIHPETSIHGRVLVEDAAGGSLTRLLVVFHGYAQGAEDALADARRIPGADGWTIASAQALHPFYARDQRTVIASWMTRQDRDLAIADNVAYVDRVIEQIAPAPAALVFAGFSQGAAMAYRAAVLGARRANGVIALGGDIPPELRPAAPDRWPAVLIGAGQSETWYTPAKLEIDLAFLRTRDVRHEVVRFAGGHEWTDEFRAAAGAWLSRIGASAGRS